MEPRGSQDAQPAFDAAAALGGLTAGAGAWIPIKAKCHELALRSILKTITYRIAGSSLSAALAFIYTHRVETCLAVGGLDAAAKLVLFYAHERVWNRIRFGMLPAEEASRS